MKKIKHFAAGGVLGVLPIDPNSNDYDAINAEKTQRWAAEDAATKAKYATTPGVAAANPMQSSLTVNPLNPTPVSASPPATTFQQDIDARQSRISAYTDHLKAMEADGRENSLMGSSSTITRSFADGGKIDPDELMRQMTAKYGAPAAGPAQPAPAQQPAPQPQPKPQQRPEAQGLNTGIIGVLKGRQQQIDKAAGYANGKSPDSRPSGESMAAMGLTVGLGGKIEGPGTPTSDSIPATISETGEQVKVSTQERILSKNQDTFLEEIAQSAGFESLNAMLEAGTGQAVGPTIKAGKRAAVTGMAPEQDLRPESQGIDSRVASAIAAPPTLGGAPMARSEPSGGPLSKSARAGGYRPEINGITWQDKTFDPTALQMAPGTGAIAITSGPNAGKNIAIGPQSYTAADGTSTNDWSKTAQYQQGLQDAQNQRNQLATMQRNRLERDAYDPSITDPNVQASARQQLHDLDAKAGKQGEAYGRMLDNQGKLAKLTSDGQMQSLQAQYLAETDPARREALAERIRGVTGKGTAAAPANLQHIETNGGVMAFDPRTGRVQPVIGADGQAIKGKATSTEDENKSAGYALRMQKALDLATLIGTDDPSALKPGFAEKAASYINEPLANSVRSTNRQRIDAANADALDAALTLATGAAYTKEQLAGLNKAYFPQIGDDEKTIADKSKRFNDIVATARLRAGNMNPKLDKLMDGKEQRPSSGGQASNGPAVGTVDGRHVYIGGNPADPTSWVEVR